MQGIPHPIDVLNTLNLDLAVAWDDRPPEILILVTLFLAPRALGSWLAGDDFASANLSCSDALLR